MLDELAILLSAALIGTVAAALFSRSVSISLICLFYASLILGIIFATYDGIVVGLVHIITFAGAISVMLLTVVLMTGEATLAVGKRTLALLLLLLSIPVVAASTYEILAGLPETVPGPTLGQVTSLFDFIWLYRPWDLLILIMVFAASMVAVINIVASKR